MEPILRNETRQPRCGSWQIPTQATKSADVDGTITANAIVLQLGLIDLR
jgi:hypothetical protein